MLKKGFTLVEILIVVAIIGILLLIAVPRMGGTRVARENATRANHRILVQAVIAYTAQNKGQIPRTHPALQPWLGTTFFPGINGGASSPHNSGSDATPAGAFYAFSTHTNLEGHAWATRIFTFLDGQLIEFWSSSSHPDALNQSHPW